MIILTDDFDARVAPCILRDYVQNLRAEFVAVYGQIIGDENTAKRLKQSLKISANVWVASAISGCKIRWIVP